MKEIFENIADLKCSVCDGAGFVTMVFPLPFSNGEIVERFKDPCPKCR